MIAGLGTFVTTVALVCGTYALPSVPLRWACLAALAAIWLLTPVPQPKRKARADGSTEDAKATKGKGS